MPDKTQEGPSRERGSRTAADPAANLLTERQELVLASLAAAEPFDTRVIGFTRPQRGGISPVVRRPGGLVQRVSTAGRLQRVGLLELRRMLDGMRGWR